MLRVRDPETTLGKLIDRQSVAYIASVDAEGFPALKAMLAPRVREGRYYSNFSSGNFTVD